MDNSRLEARFIDNTELPDNAPQLIVIGVALGVERSVKFQTSFTDSAPIAFTEPHRISSFYYLRINTIDVLGLTLTTLRVATQEITKKLSLYS